MGLKPDAEVSIALATGVLAYAGYQMALPATADIRSMEPNNADIQASERVAAWTAAGLVSLVALLTKSPSVFCVGGLVVIGSSWTARHADQVSNVSKRASSLVPVPSSGADGVVGDDVAVSQQASSTPLYGVAV